MSNEMTIQVHTHKVVTEARCNVQRPCNPLTQAIRRKWLINFSGVDMGEFSRIIGVGDMELGYLSGFNFCPFCGFDLTSNPAYARFEDGKPRFYDQNTTKEDPPT